MKTLKELFNLIVEMVRSGKKSKRDITNFIKQFPETKQYLTEELLKEFKIRTLKDKNYKLPYLIRNLCGDNQDRDLIYNKIRSEFSEEDIVNEILKGNTRYDNLSILVSGLSNVELILKLMESRVYVRYYIEQAIIDPVVLDAIENYNKVNRL